MDDHGAVSDRAFTEAVAGLRMWSRVAVWRVVWLHRVLLGAVTSFALLVSWWQIRTFDWSAVSLHLSLRGGFTP